MKITKAHALKAVLMGACFVPTIGQDCSELSHSHLIWAEDHSIGEIGAGELPLWVRSGYGDGDGSGSGSGSGDGDGDGSGSGDGDGSGDGYGYDYQEAFKELKVI
jgi:hypothetical protein